MLLARAGGPCRLGLCCAHRRGGLPAAPVHAQRRAGVVGQHRRGRVGAHALALRRRAALRLRRRRAPRTNPNPNPNPNLNPNQDASPELQSGRALTIHVTLTRRALRVEPARPAAPRALRNLPGACRLHCGERESPLRRHEPRRPARLPPARPGGGAHGHTAAQPKGDLKEIYWAARPAAYCRVR